jgi:hypothetical protein
MSNLWRIVNPALIPAQVVAESGDEQAILRQCATRDASDGLKLLKSEDDGTTWVEVEVRAPDAVAPVAEKSDAETRRPVGGTTGAGSSSGASSGAGGDELETRSSTKHRK